MYLRACAPTALELIYKRCAIGMLWLTQTLKHALKILESEAGAGGGTKFACKSVLIIIAKTRKHCERKQKHHRDARGDAFCRRRGLARGRPKDERKNFARERRRCFCGVGIIVVVGAAEEDFQLGRNFGIYTFENFTTTRGW